MAASGLNSVGVCCNASLSHEEHGVPACRPTSAVRGLRVQVRMALSSPADNGCGQRRMSQRPTTAILGMSTERRFPVSTIQHDEERARHRLEEENRVLEGELQDLESQEEALERR